MNAVATPIPTAKSRARKSASATGRKGADRVKASLLLSAETSLKLRVAATLAGVDQSAFAERVIAAAVRHVVISVRGERDTVGIGEGAAA